MTQATQETTFPDTELERAQNEMTPQAYLELESHVKAMEDAAVMPEAGGIAFASFAGKHGGVLNVTARAQHPTRACQMLLESLSYVRSLQPDTKWAVTAKDKYGNPVVVSSAAPAPAPTQQVAQPADPQEPQYVDIVEPDTTPQPPPPPATGVQLMDIARIEVTPRPDARVDLKLFAPNHQYPDLRIVNWTIQSVLDNIADPQLGWAVPLLSVANELTGKYTAHWEYSAKTNKEGKPYKDIKRILPG